MTETKTNELIKKLRETETMKEYGEKASKCVYT